MSQLKIKNGNSWESIPAGGIGVPSGGTTGQVLQKSSNTDYATEWANKQTLKCLEISGTTSGSAYRNWYYVDITPNIDLENVVSVVVTSEVYNSPAFGAVYHDGTMHTVFVRLMSNNPSARITANVWYLE